MNCISAPILLFIWAVTGALSAPQNVRFKSISPHLTSYVLNGKHAETGQFPWIAYIHVKHAKGSLVCTGSILDANTILTASHCLCNDNNNITIQAGMTDAHKWGKFEQQQKGKVFYRHPKFTEEICKGDLTDIKSFDLAIIKTKGKFNFTRYIKPIELGCFAETKPGLGVMIAGYGQDDDKKLGKLKFAVVQIVKCNNYHNFSVCSNHTEKSMYSGDSGGPLIGLTNVKKYMVCGVNTGLTFNKDGPQYNYFTSIYEHCDFVKEHMGNKHVGKPNAILAVDGSLEKSGKQNGATGKPGGKKNGSTGKPGGKKNGATGKPGGKKNGSTGKPGGKKNGSTGKPGGKKNGSTGKPGGKKNGATSKAGGKKNGATSKPGGKNNDATGKSGGKNNGSTGKPSGKKNGSTGKPSGKKNGAPKKSKNGATGKPAGKKVGKKYGPTKKPEGKQNDAKSES